MTAQPTPGTTRGRWDAQRAAKADHDAHIQPRRCINCGKDCRPRYLYCTDQCSAQSRAKQRAKESA